MKIPNGDRAELGTKVEDYSLNSLHRQGQHKARVFESVLGITLANANHMRNANPRLTFSVSLSSSPNRFPLYARRPKQRGLAELSNKVKV